MLYEMILFDNGKPAINFKNVYTTHNFTLNSLKRLL